MDYTLSDAYVTHTATGRRMHQDTAPVTTMVTARDMNCVTWSLMELLGAAGVSGVAFDPDNAATYQKLKLAMDRLYGRTAVFRPAQYGSVSAGADASALVQAAVNAAFAWTATNGGRALVDLYGRWDVAQSITIPAGKSVDMIGGELRALPAFPSGEYIISAPQESDRAYEDVEFANIRLECSGRCNGIRFNNGFRSRMVGLRVLHYTVKGIFVDETLDAHEVLLRDCWAMEKLYEEPGWFAGPYTGTGIEVKPKDCELIGCISMYTGVPLKIDGECTDVRGGHYGSGSVLIGPGAIGVQIQGVYFDVVRKFEVQDPWHTKITGCRFLHLTSDASLSCITLKPLNAGRSMNGVLISGNLFKNNDPTVIDSVKVDTSVGSFNSANITNCSMIDNSFVNVTSRTTRPKRVSYLTAVTEWPFNLAAAVPFGAVQHVLHSFRPDSGTPVASIVTVVGNTVTCKLAAASNGTMYIEADVSFHA